MTEAIVRGSLEIWAREKPNMPAVIEGDRILTWGEWNALSDRLAEGLVRRGVGPEDIVGVRLQIRAEWPVVASAVSKIGARILVLNWRLTPEETHYVLSSSGATALICDDPEPSALVGAMRDLPIKFAASIDIEADGFVPFVSLFTDGAPARVAQGDAPLVIYTSGTTGLPKGVAGLTPSDVTRETLEYLADIAESRPHVSGEVVLVTMPMHHGAGPGLVRGSTRMGNTMIFLRRFDPVEALRLIETYRVTSWTGVPTMYKRIASLPDETLARFDVSSIRSLSVGAAPVPPSLKTWITRYFGDCLHEGYGATEVGMITATTPEMNRLKPGSSGLPHKHVSIHIRDDEGRPLPPGATGEIWVKTPVTIRSYLNAPPLDETTRDAEGYFRVGDAGYLDEEGYLFITDRVKDMIISGGVNIYPAEVEAALIRHPAIQDVAVIGIPDEEFGERVKAICELKPGRSSSEADVLRYCAEHLASYKRPKSIDFVEELPRNTMGKILKRELRAPYWADRERKV